jgi:hypothetical protein
LPEAWFTVLLCEEKMRKKDGISELGLLLAAVAFPFQARLQNLNRPMQEKCNPSITQMTEVFSRRGKDKT